MEIQFLKFELVSCWGEFGGELQYFVDSIAVSVFADIFIELTNTNNSIRRQDPNNFSDTETRWLVCALANFFSRIAIVFQRAVDQNALLLQMVPIKKRIRTAS